MAEFLYSSNIASQIINIINSASKFLVLVSPFLTEIQEEVFKGIKKADERKVKINILCGKSEQWKGVIKLDQNVINKLNEAENLSIYYIQNLHAKCYFNEKSLIITSMNLYDLNTVNLEMGVLLDVEGDSDAYYEAVKAVDVLLDPRRRIVFRERKTKGIKRIQAIERGYCIRCKTIIPQHEMFPYCLNCYRSWSRYKNPDYIDKYCHICGEEVGVTFNHPYCRECIEWLCSG